MMTLSFGPPRLGRGVHQLRAIIFSGIQNTNYFTKVAPNGHCARVGRMRRTPHRPRNQEPNWKHTIVRYCRYSRQVGNIRRYTSLFFCILAFLVLPLTSQNAKIILISSYEVFMLKSGFTFDGEARFFIACFGNN